MRQCTATTTTHFLDFTISRAASETSQQCETSRYDKLGAALTSARELSATPVTFRQRLRLRWRKPGMDWARQLTPLQLQQSRWREEVSSKASCA